MLNANKIKNSAPKIKEKINLQLPPIYYTITKYGSLYYYNIRKEKSQLKIIG